MKFREFFGVFEKGFIDIARRPFLILPGIFIFGFIWALSKFGGNVAQGFQSSSGNIVWLVFYGLILLLMGGFVEAGWIGSLNRKDFFVSAWNFWWSSFLVLLIFVILFNIVNVVLYGFTFLMSLHPVVSVEVFKILSFILAFLITGGFVMFFSFSNFYVVLNDFGVLKSVRASWKLVRREYLSVLSMSVLFFVVVFLITKIEGFVGDLINYGIVLPLMFSIYTRFVAEFGK